MRTLLGDGILGIGVRSAEVDVVQSVWRLRSDGHLTCKKILAIKESSKQRLSCQAARGTARKSWYPALVLDSAASPSVAPPVPSNPMWPCRLIALGHRQMVAGRTPTNPKPLMVCGGGQTLVCMPSRQLTRCTQLPVSRFSLVNPCAA